MTEETVQIIHLVLIAVCLVIVAIVEGAAP